jgi:excisionase family DNA binding protein
MSLKLNRLSAKQVAAISADGLYADGGGLYLRVKRGNRSWVYIYRRQRWGGKRGELGLGPLHTVSLAKARKLAEDERARVQDNTDPIAYHDERKRRLALGGDPTLRQVAEEWMAVMSRGENPHWKEATQIDRKRTFNGPRCKLLHDRLVKDITADDIFQIVSADWQKKPAAAKKFVKLCEPVFDWAIAREKYFGKNPASLKKGMPLSVLLADKQPASKPHAALPYQLAPALMAKFEFTPRTFFTVGEAARAVGLGYTTVYKAIIDGRLPATKAERPIYRGAYQEWHIEPAVLFNVWPQQAEVIPGLPSVTDTLIRFSILTAQRPDEIRRMRWPEWAKTENLWILPWQRTKEGRNILQDQVIPLSQPCVEILVALETQQKRDGVPTEFVFGNYITANMTSSIIGKPPATRTVLTRLRLKLPPEQAAATMHGFRTAFRSWGDEQGYAEKDLERAIGHRAGFGETEVSRLYSRQSKRIKPLVEIFDAWAKYCLSPPADIIVFPRQAQGA